MSENGEQMTTLKYQNEKEPPRKSGIFTATSKPPPPLPGFRNFTEQVAGHLETHHVPCFMVDNDGHILKILDKGTKLVYMEQEFYEKIFDRENHTNEWVELKKFIPCFYGTITLMHNERKFCYLKLENLVDGLVKPCIMDMKIGKITYDPFATPEKIHRELIRYDYQAQLGFRITGFKVFKARTGVVELYDRFHCKKFVPDDIEPTFLYFFDLENYPERIYLLEKMLKQLKSLKNWFSSQKRVKFYCTSLLIAYDGSIKSINKTKNPRITCQRRKEEIDYQNGKFMNTETPKHFKQIEGTSILNKDELISIHGQDNVTEKDVAVSMIDFTHTFIDAEGMSDTIDENYIYGLQTLISLFQNMFDAFSVQIIK